MKISEQQILVKFPQSKIWEKGSKRRLYVVDKTKPTHYNQCYVEKGEFIVPTIFYANAETIHRDGSSSRDKIYITKEVRDDIAAYFAKKLGE